MATHPNFSGTWEAFTPDLQSAEKQLGRTEALHAKGLVNQQQLEAAMAAVQKQRGGEIVVIAHTATTMKVTGQSGQVFASYKLDGSESRYGADGAGITARASWLTADRLVATETRTQPNGTTTHGKRFWMIDPDGLLSMQWTAVDSKGQEVGITVTTYRRIKMP